VATRLGNNSRGRQQRRKGVTVKADHDSMKNEGAATSGGEVESAVEPKKGKMGDSYGSDNRDSSCLARETTLNSLITGVIFGEIALSNSWATVGTPLRMTILIGLVQSIHTFDTYCI